jgi:hypothetical protein
MLLIQKFTFNCISNALANGLGLQSVLPQQPTARRTGKHRSLKLAAISLIYKHLLRINSVDAQPYQQIKEFKSSGTPPLDEPEAAFI